MNENTNTKTANNVFRQVYKMTDCEFRGKKYSRPSLAGTVLKFDLQAEIERLIDAGVSDTDILEAIREADAQAVSILSSGKVKGMESYGNIALTNNEVINIHSVEPPRKQSRAATLADTFAIKEGEGKVDYIKRIYRENGGKIALEEIARQYEVQSISDSEIEKALENL